MKKENLYRKLFDGACKLPLLVLLLLFFVNAASFAQKTAREDIIAHPEKASGVYRMYDFATPSSTKPPKGYTEFYVSTYNRHGARFALKDEHYDSVMIVLQLAHDRKMLTARGEEVYRKFAELYPMVKNRAGDLSELGARQLKRLGKRFYAAHKGLLEEKPQTVAYGTVVPRVILSMGAFCEGLKEEIPALQIYKEVSMANMPWLNPNNTINPYRTHKDKLWTAGTGESPWYGDFVRFSRSRVNTERFTNSIFADSAFMRSVMTPFTFMQYMFYNCIDLHCVPIDNIRFDDLFTNEEKYGLWACENYFYYRTKGPDPVCKGRGSKMAKLMLEEFLSSTEKDLAANKPFVRLRFGHDGCIMELMTLLGFEEWKTVTSDTGQWENVWRHDRVPTAANMQWVFFRNKQKPDDILVKFLYNEQEHNIPITTDVYPYYHWKDLQHYMKNVVDKTNLKENWFNEKL